MAKNALLIFFLFAAPIIFLTAQEGTDSADGSAAQAALNAAEAARFATIKYGTETEIAALITSLKNEGAEYLDDELIILVNGTRNQRILSGVFSFFAEREKAGLEERAMQAIIDRDIEASETVLTAIDYLGKVKASQAEETLREVLDSGERRFMNISFKALGRIGGTGRETGDSVAEYLVDYYTNREPGDENRRDLIIAIGDTRSSIGVSFLSSIALDNDERVPLRIAAIEAIGRTGNPDGLEAVLAGVSASDPNIRSSAVAALGPFSGDNVDNTILEAFRDSFFRTRLAAARASRERKLVAAIPYLKYRSERDEVPQIKDEAIRALGAIGNSEAIDILNALFVDRKSPDRVRMEAALALMQNAPDKYMAQLVIELDDAKKNNMNSLYNGFLKVVGESHSNSHTDITRRFLQSGGIIEKSYGLDMAANNNLVNLSEEIKKVSEDRNESLARKARRTMEKLGIE